MEVISPKNQINQISRQRKAEGSSVGFVPTMGALHEGHLSLVRRALNENAITVVSIFVNPTQFDNPEDLQKYPRMPDEDRQVLENMGVDYVFMPRQQEMYPPGEELETYDFGHLDKVMEGRYRKGHFNGVAQIVRRLFRATEPDRAYFGRKDFQQLTIIRELVRQLEMPVKIVACPIVRESDGLAMSSRNLRLSVEQRKHASVIYQTLKQAVEKKQELSVPEVKQWVSSRINNEPWMEAEYFDIVDGNNLQSITRWGDVAEKVGCIAAYCGETRLIDNICF